MKYFDIVNKNDKVIGKKTAKECHSNANLIHRVVHFTLIDLVQKKVLISQRSFKVKFDSGKWCFMGEHVLSGESYTRAVIKGVKNELGIKAVEFSEVANKIFTYATQSEFVRFYLAEWNGEVLHPDTAEIIDTKWVTVAELVTNKSRYSKMTEHWIDVVDWDGVFN